MADDFTTLDLEEDWKILRPSPHGRVLSLVDQRFGRLLVLERAGSNKRRESMWRCVCDCGNEKAVSKPYLVGGHVKSCGCLRAEYNRSPKADQLRRARVSRRQKRPGKEADFINRGVDPDDLIDGVHTGGDGASRIGFTPHAAPQTNIQDALEELADRLDRAANVGRSDT